MFIKSIKVAIVALMVAFFVWVGASWIDVIADNTAPNPQHASWNLFVIMLDMAE